MICKLHEINLIGTGKSQFLKFAAKLSSRSVITTGLGSTSAGLTVTAVKDAGTYSLIYNVYALIFLTLIWDPFDMANCRSKEARASLFKDSNLFIIGHPYYLEEDKDASFLWKFVNHMSACVTKSTRNFFCLFFFILNHS